MELKYKKGFIPASPYEKEQETVLFGLYNEIDGSSVGEILMVWNKTCNGFEYEMIVKSESWRVVLESPDLFRLLHKYDNGKLTPTIFYELLFKAGYNVL